MVACVHPSAWATGEAGHRSFDCAFPMLSGYEKLRDPTPGMGKDSLRSHRLPVLAPGSLDLHGAGDIRFSDSWAPQMPLDASEELRMV